MHPPTQVATGFQLNAALQRSERCIGLKTTIRQDALHLNALHGNTRQRGFSNGGRATDRKGAHGQATCTRQLARRRFGLVSRRDDDTKAIDVEICRTPPVATLISTGRQSVQAQLPLTTVQANDLGPGICIENGLERAGHGGLLGRHRQASSTTQFTVETSRPALGYLQRSEARLIQHQADVGLQRRQRTVHAPPRRDLPPQRHPDQGGETTQVEGLEFKAALKFTNLQPPLRQLQRQARFRPQHGTGEAIQHQRGILR